MRQLLLNRIIVYDPSDELRRDSYQIYVYFDPANRGDWGYLMRTEAAKAVGTKLVRLDYGVIPDFIGRFKIEAPEIIEDADSFQARSFHVGYDLGVGITFWIERSPEWSRLRNEILVQWKIEEMRGDLQKQLPFSIP
jgi:hypothetical protein